MNEFCTRLPMVLSVMVLGVFALCGGGVHSGTGPEFMRDFLYTRAPGSIYLRAI